MRTLATLLILLTCLHGAAIEAKPQERRDTEPTQPVGNAASIVQTDVELQLAKAQLATIKEYHSSLLDTVYWALGTLATVVTLLAGFGWFANFRLYESDKKRLREELEVLIRTNNNTQESSITAREANLLLQVDTKLDTAAQRSNREIDQFRQDVIRSIDEIKSKLAEFTTAITSLKSGQESNAKSIKKVEALVREVEELSWEIKGIPTNVLITQYQGLRAAIEADSTEDIKSILERMKETIKDKILKKGHSMGESMLGYMREDLVITARTDPVLSAEVQGLLKSIPVKKDDDSAAA